MIEFNFDKKGSTHKTVFGGCISIFYAIFIIAYSSFGFSNIENHSKDKISVFTSSVNLQDLGVVNLNESGFLMYSLIVGSKIKNEFEDMLRYLDVYYQQCERDIFNKSGCIKSKRIEAKWCT